jgi:NTP pyrophosphatase (non-canonical NTP hydrolase)
MNIKEAQELMHLIYYRRDQARGIERTLLRTFEELGELSDAVLGKRSKEAIEEEMADVFAWLCSLANLLGVDLSQALLKKYPDVCYRCRKAPCQCKDSD